MKKKIITALAIGMLSVSSFIACNKTNSPVTENIAQKAEQFLDKPSGENPSIDFSDDEITMIGTEHNRLCKAIVDEVTSNDKTLFEGINTVAINNSYSAFTAEEYEQMIQRYGAENIENTQAVFLESITNPTQKQILVKLLNALETENLSSIRNSLLELKDYANLINFERISTLIAIDVALNSATMWLPKSQGGEGYFDKVNTYENSIFGGKSSNTLSTAKKVAGVIGTDFIGAYGGFLRAALPYFLSGGPANPVANGVLLGSAIIGGATASAGGAFMAALR